jgi:hypothetical protein
MSIRDTLLPHMYDANKVILGSDLGITMLVIAALPLRVSFTRVSACDIPWFLESCHPISGRLVAIKLRSTVCISSIPSVVSPGPCGV